MTLKLTVEQIARVAHEVNREYSKSIGDPVKPSWEEAPEDQRVSCIKGVEFHLANPTSAPGDSHAEWLSHKVQTGWTYGENIDPIRMTHPNLVVFDRLSVAQQAKDFIFVAIVRQLAGLEASSGSRTILGDVGEHGYFQWMSDGTSRKITKEEHDRLNTLSREELEKACNVDDLSRKTLVQHMVETVNVQGEQIGVLAPEKA